MPTSKNIAFSVAAIGLFSLQATASPLQEAREFTLALKQLAKAEAILNRAERQAHSTASHPDTRFTFDYDALRADLQRVTTGIEQYLSPSRAQPRDVTELQGDYVRDRGHP